jgi:hypothetical protein
MRGLVAFGVHVRVLQCPLWQQVEVVGYLQAWGVHVKEVWSVEAQLPATPMGDLDRSAATSFHGDVRVFHVDEEAGKLRCHQPQAVC